MLGSRLMILQNQQRASSTHGRTARLGRALMRVLTNHKIFMSL